MPNIASMTTEELLDDLNALAARGLKAYPKLAHLREIDAEATRQLDQERHTLIVINGDILRWDSLSWTQRRRDCSLRHDGCAGVGLEVVDPYELGTVDTATSVYACDPCIGSRCDAI